MQLAFLEAVEAEGAQQILLLAHHLVGLAVIVAEDVESVRDATSIAGRLHQEFQVPFVWSPERQKGSVADHLERKKIAPAELAEFAIARSAAPPPKLSRQRSSASIRAAHCW